MSGKCIVCPCEDVTLSDVMQAFSLGYLDIEEVKRFTGLGTGMCQGKQCMVSACLLLDEALKKTTDRASQHPESSKEPVPFRQRPPVAPVTLGILAQGKGVPRGR